MALLIYPAAGALRESIRFADDAELISELRRFMRQSQTAGGAWFSTTDDDGCANAVWISAGTSVRFEFDDPASVDDVRGELAVE